MLYEKWTLFDCFLCCLPSTTHVIKKREFIDKQMMLNPIVLENYVKIVTVVVIVTVTI